MPDTRLARACVMRVLLAVDDSAHSAAAVDAVLNRPWPTGSLVRVITVVVLEPIAIEPWFAPANLDAFQAAATDRAEAFVHDVVARLRGHGLIADAVVRSGEPRTAIVDEAQSWGGRPDRPRLARPHGTPPASARQRRAIRGFARAVLRRGGSPARMRSSAFSASRRSASRRRPRSPTASRCSLPSPRSPASGKPRRCSRGARGCRGSCRRCSRPSRRSSSSDP